MAPPPPRGGRRWEAPSFRTLGTRQSKTAAVLAAGRNPAPKKKEDDLDNPKGLSLWSRFDFSNLILQGWRKWCRRRFALSSRVNLILMEGAAPTSWETKAFYSSLEQIQHRQGYVSPLASPNGAWSRHRDRKQAAPFRACFLFPFIAS